jgi:hypothetical protein
VDIEVVEEINELQLDNNMKEKKKSFHFKILELELNLRN